MSRSGACVVLAASLIVGLAAPVSARQENVSSEARAGTSLRVLTPLGDDVFAVERLDGEEALSRLFSFQLEITVDRAIPFETLLGKPVTILLEQPGEGGRSFHGIVARIAQADAGRSSSSYVLDVVPELWLLTLEQRSRLFQGLSVPEIVDRVLREGGIAYESRLEGDYPQRDCVVQYRESDFAFVSRLLEEEGIYYFFEHAPDGHRLVLGDSPASHSALAGRDGVPFRAGRQRGGGAITEWTKVQELRSGKVTLRDFDFHDPDLDLEVSAAIQESVVVGQVGHRLRVDQNAGLEVYDYPGEYAQRFDEIAPSAPRLLAEGERTVAIRAEEEAAAGLVVRGASLHAHLTAGHRFTLVQHLDADGEYVLTAVRHHAGRAQSDRGPIEYSNTFTCIPVGLPFRPQRTTPAPRIAGVQTAIVTGPSGEETHTDELGRVKVQFHWDREGQRDEHSSCWIRVASPPAGHEVDPAAAPRIGQEVVVGFVEGDPDQPIILGRVYNGAQPPPVR